MEIFLILFVTLFIIFPIIFLSFLDKFKQSEGKKAYLNVLQKLKKGENEDKIRDDLKRQYNLTIFTASVLVSAAKRQLGELFEQTINSKVEKDKKGNNLLS